MRVYLTMKSRNEKTGPMPVSTTESRSCPASCPLREKGCYAKLGPLGLFWGKIDNGAAGMAWADFTAIIAKLPAGTMWRHNQAGDLPGHGDEIDGAALAQLVQANAEKQGFTYTHKPMTPANKAAVKAANAAGFTINLSADNLAEADQLMAEQAGPVVVILDKPEGQRHTMTTPAGHKIETCPVAYGAAKDCKSCGLCAKRDRKVIVGFPAHGVTKKAAAAIARG